MALITAEEYLKQKTNPKQVTPATKPKGLISAEEYLRQKQQGVKPTPTTPKPMPIAPIPMPRLSQGIGGLKVIEGSLPLPTQEAQSRIQTTANAPTSIQPALNVVNRALTSYEQSPVGRISARAGEGANETRFAQEGLVQTKTGDPRSDWLAENIGRILGYVDPSAAGAPYVAAEKVLASGVTKTLGRKAATLGAAGAVSGATRGVVRDKDAKGVAKEAVTEGALSATGGALLHGAEKVVGKVATKLAEKKVEKGRQILADANEAYANAKVEVPIKKPMPKQTEKTTHPKILQQTKIKSPSPKSNFLEEIKEGKLPHETTAARQNMDIITNAKTGEPIKITGFRQQRGVQNQGTGDFFAISPNYSALYGGKVDGKYTNIGPKHTLIVEPIELKNPLVVEGGQRDITRTLMPLLNKDDPLHSQILKAVQNLYNVTEYGGETGYAILDKLINKAAVKLGYDGIIYRKSTSFANTNMPMNGTEVMRVNLVKTKPKLPQNIPEKPTMPEKAPFDARTLPAKGQPKAEANAGQLAHLEAKLAQQVNETVEPAVAKVGLRVQKLQNEPKVGKTSPEYKFSDPKVEARWQEASKGVQKETLWQQTKEAFKSFGRKITREYENLPHTKKWSQARFDLLKLEKQKGIAGDRTLRIQQGITAKLEKSEFDLFTRKVILDDLAREEGDLPFGFDKNSLIKERSAIDAAVTSSPKIAGAVSQRKQAWDAIKNDYIQAMKDIGFDVSDRLSKEDYFRHQVLEYANARAISGTGQRLKSPTGRGFLKVREGSAKDINANYLQAEYEVMAQMIHDIEVAKTIKNIEKNYSIRDTLVKKHGKKWSENIPEGYVTWQPRQGSGFYLADSIPAKVAERLYSGAAKEVGITEDMLSKVIAKGSRFREFVIKEELAKTLNKLSEPPSESIVGKFSSGLTGLWKEWQLISPRRFIKYNLRNISGDLDKALTGNPKSITKVPQATRELYQIFAGNRAMTPDMKDWFERGGMQTLLQVQELGDINKLKMFADIQEAKGTVKELPIKAWQGYWKTARISSDFREAIIRYANYLDYFDQMKKNNGKPLNFGASIPEEVMGLKDIKDRAFKMSNELLGAYDAVSVLGKDIRKHVIPFWSFQETNFRSYVQMIKNAARDEKLAQFAGRKLLGYAVRSPVIAMRVGSFAIKASGMWAALQAYNYMRFPEEERALPKDVQARPHIVLGRDAEGNVRYFDRLGTLGDFLGWFGLDTPAREVADYLDGKRTVKEIAIDMAKSPVSKLAQGVTPLIKTPPELLTGRKFFPDALKPGYIRDRWEYLAQSVGLENEYKALAGKPSKPYLESASGLYEYKTNPDQVAYYNIQDEKRRFQKKIGKMSEGFMTSPKSEVLYNYKLALKLRDQEAAKKYLREYMLLGGAQKDMERSLETMHPLYGLNRDDVKQFLQSLRQEERDELAKGIRYYESLVPPELARRGRKKYKGAPKV